MTSDFQKFVADPRLRTAQEVLKRSTNIFEIIEHNENQHSEILKWLIDPREGHGQGDSIFKDLLTAAYFYPYGHIKSNKQFFDAWTPSRIARTGFHSMMVFREFTLPNNKRLDLLVIDPVNHIVVILENKHGDRLGHDQLKAYYQWSSKLCQPNGAFHDYCVAHIVLDCNYDDAEGGSTLDIHHQQWAFIDYQWLKHGASRAEQQQKRGNQSASLVIAYCQKQTDYIPPELIELDDVLAGVVDNYPNLVLSFTGILKEKDITLVSEKLTGEKLEQWIFIQNNQRLIERLLLMNKLSFLMTQIRATLPHNRSITADYGKSYVAIFDETWRTFHDPEKKFWPIYVGVQQKEADLYEVYAHYRIDSVKDAYQDSFAAAFGEHFLELKHSKGDASYRTLGKAMDVRKDKLTVTVKALYDRVYKTIETIET